MKYGAMNFPVKPVLEEVQRISDLGFDYVELALDPPRAHWEVIRGMEKELAAALARNRLDLVCHLPTFVYTADLCPALRQASLDEMGRSLEIAAHLGAQKAILHPSMISGLGPFVMETAKALALESLHLISEKAASLGIPLCLENMFPRYLSCFEPKHFKEIFKAFPSLNMCLDTGHANIDDPEQKRLSLFIRKFSDRISHIHISDNHGKKDNHLGVGQGAIDFKKLVRQIMDAGFDATVTFEVFSEDPGDLVQSRDRIASWVRSAR
jgi:sugar phosphate isomerase/epimerase